MTEERKKIMLALPDTLYDLYGSIELGKKIKTIIHTYKLTNNKDTVLIDIIGDTILGFYLTKDLPKKLQAELGISAEDSLTIVSEFSGLFTPVIEREKSLTGQKMEELKSLQTQFAAAPGTRPAPEPVIPAVTETSTTSTIGTEPTTTTQAQTIETPADMARNVTPMRTMAADMDRVHGYGAYRANEPQSSELESEPVTHTQSQADLLQK